MWNLWKARNKVRFDNTAMNAQIIINNIKEQILFVMLHKDLLVNVFNCFIMFLLNDTFVIFLV